jgi:uncharacterized protein (TIGR02246 family)
MKTRLALFAVVVVALVLFDHVRGIESEGRTGRGSDAASEHSADKLPVGTDSKVAVEIGRNEEAGPSGIAANEDADTAIRKTADAFATAFDRGDAAAIAALWTIDGDYRDGEGNRFVGRDAIERQYARFFAEHPNAKIEITIDAIRPIGSDAAIEDGHAALRPSLPDGPQSSPYTVIHAKVDGKWLMASVREPSAGQPEADNPLASLDWLVGSWSAGHGDGKMDVTFRWVASRSFLERTYSVEHGGRITASGVQLIGLDPSSQELQSWSFTSDAGFAVGSWIPQPDGWAIATRGKLPDGTTTAAVNYLTRLDANTLTWQSRERGAGGVSLPDTEAVRLTRVAAPR